MYKLDVTAIKTNICQEENANGLCKNERKNKTKNPKVRRFHLLTR